jgi:hypothetical protein
VEKVHLKKMNLAYFTMIFENFFFEFSLEYPKEDSYKKETKNVHNFLICELVCLGEKKRLHMTL